MFASGFCISNENSIFAAVSAIDRAITIIKPNIISILY
ncbi:hypothetical protein phiST2_0015 [Vibrio phage phi-ST2]|nr:hypothetical protein phiST2_0015 [Vibrio phage phi-ST2]